MTANKTITALAATAALALPTMATAATTEFRANLEELNGSGVSGTVDFSVDAVAQTIRVQASVSGLEPNAVHVNHIHGRFEDEDGDFVPNEPRVPVNSVTPVPSDDTDGDGFVEVLEGLPGYGDILLSLNDPSAPDMNPMVGGSGSLVYDYTYDLSNGSPLLEASAIGLTYSFDDLTPLDLREYVIHGLTVPAGVDDSLPDGGYLASLPVAAAQIAPVPVPAAGFLLLGALGSLGFMRRRARG